MFKYNLTVFIIPSDHTDSVSIQLRSVWAKFLLCWLAVMAVFGGIFIRDYRILRSSYEHYVPDNRELAARNQDLEAVLSEQQQLIAAANLELVFVKRFDSELNELLGTRVPYQEAERAANGSGSGNAEEMDMQFLSYKKKLRPPPQAARKRLGAQDLKIELAARKKSFEELLSYLQKQKNRLDSTPSIWPVKGWLSSGFGYRISPFTGKRSMHAGLDISGRRGMRINAVADGVVVYVGWKKGYGKTVMLDHGYGFKTLYAHNSVLKVKQGQKVRRGQEVAKMGSTGNSTGPHLHYEVRLSNRPVNPYRYIIN